MGEPGFDQLAKTVGSCGPHLGGPGFDQLAKTVGSCGPHHVGDPWMAG